jgi:hypothetical protein
MNMQRWLISSLLLFLTANNAKADSFSFEELKTVFLHHTKDSPLPIEVIFALCQQESNRRYKNNKSGPWPYTLNDGGTPLYFDTHLSALNYLDSEVSNGNINIDVGMCQINLRFHHEKTGLSRQDLSRLLLPAHNLTIATDILCRLWRETQSLTTAIGYYHNRSKTLSERYRQKVVSHVTRAKEIFNVN